ncbi:hypothetical protein GII33_12015 [Gordonia pseudamarae]|jgi:hypothetical protein|uniref:Low molecular weight antigen MTB12-like C-terminal domain-containing protein n=2 Tax=Gordoniaceae TaxID=85026 RepID=A0ABX6INI4_9ACTN|nr:hypothetical protein [Gordonia sp. (in: high G+C Gram-positive bacteria)]QHN28649.1 hypothetical protein GII33_12015 [Gordonia pseudamarae]QHN37522.1 hypothetical protein GII31_11845 [Gordonia pseudamarae]
MRRMVRVVTVGVFAMLLSVGLVSPASADVSIRSGKVADLYVRSAQPSIAEMERQYAAFWNPNLPINPKFEVSVNGNNPTVQKNLRNVMATSRTYDFFSIQGRVVGKPVVNGNRMTIRGNGVMAGFPAQSFTYYYVRQGGLWKFDWKANCKASGCNGVTSWGY